MPTGHPRNPVRSNHHYGGLACISFETNAEAAPDGLEDPGNMVSSVARSAAGVYIVTLRDEYRRVKATANYTEIPDFEVDEALHAHVTATAAGGGTTATVTVQVENVNGEPFDSEDKTIDVWIWTDSRYVT